MANMAKFDLTKIIQWLAHILRCPICGHRYNFEKTKIIDSNDGNQPIGGNILVHTDCEKCKSSVVFSIAIDGPEIFSVGMVTDLTSNDTSKFRNSQPLSANDALAMHEFLDSFNGDFRSVLK